ncbi:ninja-family protein mc410 isoform X2 [Mercurialis annua]|uniref:ninja-family protein mc410 isoform X2 n=1 Tax=Mercurialis annua TaxID=3986 RepID=UPI00215FFCBF|nr:ninja-family protein mc410 isoform X2 [Mercurialis annua]
MEDDNGLELSLGLGCGGSSVKSKGKNSSPSDARTEEGDKGNKLVDDFKNFLHGGAQKQDSSSGSQMSDTVKPQENFFNDLSKANADTDTSINVNSRGLWISSSNRHAETEEEKRAEAGYKRKMLFDDMDNRKKHDRDSHHSDLHDKKSHISITEDGSTAENEDVGESEVGSNSRLVSNHDDVSKRFIGVGGPSEVPKEVRGFSDSSVIDLQGRKRPNSSLESEVKQGNSNYGVPFPIRPVNVMNMPYSFSAKESNSIGAPGIAGHPLQGMMQLPTLDKDNSWGLVSQQFHPSYAIRGPSNSDKKNDGFKMTPAMQVIPRNASEASLYDGRILDHVKGDGKQTEEGSSSHTEDDAKASSMNLRPRDISGPSSTAEGHSFDFSAIKPGIAPEVKFGGCGSYPNLPWVSTTGSGPNGRTISGVTYRYSANQIRIVCACHGSHMSPDEFVRHASDENVNPENGGLASLPSNNPAASAQS